MWIWCMHLEIALSDIQYGWIHAINTRRRRKNLCQVTYDFRIILYHFVHSKHARLDSGFSFHINIFVAAFLVWTKRVIRISFDNLVEYLLFYLSFSSIIFCTINFALKSFLVLMSPATWWYFYIFKLFPSISLHCKIKKNTHFVHSFVFMSGHKKIIDNI